MTTYFCTAQIKKIGLFTSIHSCPEVALAAGKPVTPVAPAAPAPDASSPRRPPASQRVPRNNAAFAKGLQLG